MHERFLIHRKAKAFLTFTKWASLIFSIYAFLHFVAYHRIYVNKGQILQTAIESQLLFARSEAYRTLPYSQVTDEYNFCNMKTFSQEDTQGLQNYAMNNTSIPQDEILTKTADQLIKELKMEKCIFDRDDVFNILIVRETALANELKQMNRNKYSKSDDQPTIQDKLLAEYSRQNKLCAWYFYTNERALLSLQISDYRDRHNTMQHFIILSKDDFKPATFLGPVLGSIVGLGFLYDFDFIVVNQLMHTFRRQQGYMFNNVTQEYWAWGRSDYATKMTHPKYDFQSNYFRFAGWVLGTKTMRLLGAIISFMVVSFVNGLAIRIAILTSNVVIFPLMWLIKVVMGQDMTFAQRAAVYHSMGIVGAQTAYHERMGQSKSLLITSLCFTLFLICFIQTSCYFLWTQMMFPNTFPNGLNDMYFGYINLLEFACFIFVRTRMSIKYLPKFITVLNVIFMFYINSYMYSASYQYFVFMFAATIYVFCFFLLEYEHKAIHEWNPFDMYTPRLQNPRMGHQLVLDDSTFGTGFSLWHAFMPLQSRQSFTFYEQARFDMLSEQQRYGIDYSARPLQEQPQISPRTRQRIRILQNEQNQNVQDVFPQLEQEPRMIQHRNVLNAQVQPVPMPGDFELPEPLDDEEALVQNQSLATDQNSSRESQRLLRQAHEFMSRVDESDESQIEMREL